eukprot:SAG11_NODE_2165_length_3728_cov_2.060072_3_plen_390_part_00
MYLETQGRLAIESVRLVTPGAPPNGTVVATVELTAGSTVRDGDSAVLTIYDRHGKATVAAGDPVGLVGASQGSKTTAVSIEASVTIPTMVLKLWSPESPNLFTAEVKLLSSGGLVLDASNTTFGVRSIGTSGGQFLLNGEQIFLSGYGDDNVFPETYSPPLERSWYQKKFQWAKQAGFNYVRYHSHFLPDECYEVADEVGMLLSSANSIGYSAYYNAPPSGLATPAGHVLLEASWNASIVRTRNHPSAFAFCMGNEASPVYDDAKKLYRWAKALAPHQLVIDTDGSGPNTDRPTMDFVAAAFDIGDTALTSPGKYALRQPMRKPVIAHEFGEGKCVSSPFPFPSHVHVLLVSLPCAALLAFFPLSFFRVSFLSSPLPLLYNSSLKSRIV